MPKHAAQRRHPERGQAREAASPHVARRGPYGKHNRPALLLAIAAVQHQQLSQRAAAKAFQVPLTSLQNHLRRLSPVEALEEHAVRPVSVPAEQALSPPPQPLVCVLLSIDSHGSVSTSTQAECAARVGAEVRVQRSTPVLLPPLPGPPTLLSHEEEQAFAEWLIRCSDLHLPTPKSIASQKASMILERRGAKFGTASGLPSREWWDGFYRRWPAVGPRKPQPIARAKALLTKEHVSAFFADLQTLSNTIPAQVSSK